MGMQQGLGTEALARTFRDYFGLADTGERAVANYERTLRNNLPSALDRELRDRRFDDAVQSAIDDGLDLTDAKIERMVRAYANNQVNARAELIGRTEGLKITSQAHDEALRQSLAATGSREDLTGKEWASTVDGRTRPDHVQANGQRRRLNEAFNIGGSRMQVPGDGPIEQVANCRCVVLYEVFDTPAELQQWLAGGS
jgi:hypothetical protein